MKRLHLSVRLAGLILLLPLLSARAADPQPLKVFFVGNSYTYGNDLPKLIAELAKAGGQRPIEFEKHTPGGWSFKKHWEESKVADKIGAKKWDIVVLQNHSMGALAARDEMMEYGKKLAAEVQKQNARTIYFMTWARQNKPETQADITKAYQELARDVKAETAPVGLAWEAALKADPKRELHVKDMSHPNKAGSYLAACVFYAVIYHKSPEGLPGKPADLTDEAAKPLQAIAWQVVQQQLKDK
ncbi:MAG: SGNH/GDSL hydrolase family protein [Planctomycetia bacterium]|nr:SGNH/GDSL hydrolase family protein [Planctomycetia bacterium]